MTQSVMLDALDRRLVHALQLDGRAPFSRIAAVLGVPERTVTRRYHRLRSAMVVRVVGLVDSSRIGMLDWFVRVDCAPDAVDALIAVLAHRDDTSWVAALAGGSRLACMVRTPGAGAAGGRPFFEHLARTPGVRDMEASCVLRPVAGVGGWAGRTSALSKAEQARLRRLAALDDREVRQEAAGEPVDRGGPVDWDEADFRLVGELARDGRADVRRLAAATGWSASTVRRRIARLRATRMLHFEVDVDPAHFGSPIEALLWLEVAPSALGTVADALSHHAPVAFAAVTTGPASVFAMVQCRDTGVLYDYLARELSGLPGIGRTETALVQHRTKRAGPLLMPTPPAGRARRA
ncbi:Lrp/AsnC family transcriptional regulator [Streptomyces coffeae]|uniref:Lrp/AsnC family transcriptional regulator n=1 Tax=Streptomyces coffeae TaxID=621382 RepID=A0ABS1NPN8_9ACTN|nr:Lrp/AsnC family transcriptional regulator [Streptomyces coffeae]MBL1101711.1 Lrp/AsnC family transcriptional regulator [Streptomyces coffeae]